MRFLQLTLSGAFARLQSKKGMFGSTARLWFGGLVLGVGLSGCAGLNADSSSEAKQKVVAERAEARWQFMIKGDLDHAYDYLSAGSKAEMPLAVYKGKIKSNIWHKAKANWVDCKAELCSVQMLITYDFGRMKGIETPVQETWVIENGSAWFVFR
jgi:hypothetical protein